MWNMLEDMAKIRQDSTFGGQLRMARMDAGLKQEQLTALLADRYGVRVGRSYISELGRNWESNKMPMADVLAAMARALNVNGSWLLLIDDNPDLPEPDSGHGVSEEAQVKRLRAAIELEQSAQTQLQAAARAEQQRGNRADRLREIAARGPAMLTTDDTAAANVWLREYVRVFVRDNQIVEVRWL